MLAIRKMEYLSGYFSRKNMPRSTTPRRGSTKWNQIYDRTMRGNRSANEIKLEAKIKQLEKEIAQKRINTSQSNLDGSEITAQQNELLTAMSAQINRLQFDNLDLSNTCETYKQEIFVLKGNLTETELSMHRLIQDRTDDGLPSSPTASNGMSNSPVGKPPVGKSLRI